MCRSMVRSKFHFIVSSDESPAHLRHRTLIFPSRQRYARSLSLRGASRVSTSSTVDSCCPRVLPFGSCIFPSPLRLNFSNSLPLLSTTLTNEFMFPPRVLRIIKRARKSGALLAKLIPDDLLEFPKVFFLTYCYDVALFPP